MTRSRFPEELDRWPELFDLPYNKFVAAERLTTLKMKPTLTNDEQNEVVILTAELKDYLITPETMNLLTDSMTAIQEFFRDNVQGWLENKQEIWDTYIRNFKLVGVWTSATPYKFQNMVTFNGDLYLSKADHLSATSNKPVIGGNATWQQISNKGDKGDVGLTGILRGEWNRATSYVVGDAVSFGRELHYTPIVYIALKNNVGKSPGTNTGDWMLYDKVYAGATLPSGYGAGMHFIKFVD